MTFTSRKITMIVELVLVYIAIPILVQITTPGFWKVVPLMVISLAYGYLLLKDPAFPKADFFFRKINTKYFFILIVRFLISAALIFLAVYLFYKSHLFHFPKTKPLHYILSLVLYPFFSVIPQEIVFRAYFYHRFKALFPNMSIMILTNALLFSFTHIIYNNLVALSLSFLASFIFTNTYLKTRSLGITIVEHYFYGMFIFTIGLGKFFK